MSAARVVLVTGASSGIGKVCAEYLAARGFLVYGTSRQAVWPAADSPSQGLTMIPMDVTSDHSVTAAVQWLLAREGHIDIVLNNAGFGIAGAVEDCSIEEARRQFDTNFFGLLRVCHAVLPAMRQRRGGYLINVSSIGGLISIPFQGLYSASKFAVEGLTESLRMELRPFGVQAVLIEPGDFRTGFTAQRQLAAGRSGAYDEAARRAIAVMEADERGGATPEAIARRVERIVNQRRPALRHRVGPLPQRLAVTLKALLPQSWFEAAVSLYYRGG